MVNYDGTAITYDEIGNPQNWRDGMSFSWTGRQMDSVTKNGVTTTYTYDSNGLRTSKTTGDDVTEYTYLGSSLVYQVTNKGQSDEESLYFYYDDTGLAAFYYESAQYPSDNGIYHYVKDAQGNIWGIIDNKGTQIAKYEFSAYGEYRSRWSPEEVSLEEIRRNNRVRNANPFDYRGYYYDEETGLYYCQSRYYDPEVDRWLNADGIIGSNSTVLGYNLFAYCFNDPVNMSDPTGNWPKWITNAANWLNDNIFKPIGDFFSPDTNSVSGSFSEGAIKGAGSVTVGYNETMLRGQIYKETYPESKEPSLRSIHHRRFPKCTNCSISIFAFLWSINGNRHL